MADEKAQNCPCAGECWIDDPTACGDPDHCPPMTACHVCNPEGEETCAQHSDAPACPHVTIPRSCFTCGTGRFAPLSIPPEAQFDCNCYTEQEHHRLGHDIPPDMNGGET